MKENLTYTILFAILMLFLFLPIIQDETALIKVKPLNGVNVKSEKVNLNMENFSSGKYQSQLETFISENFGLREPLIRIYNQYLWSFFRKSYCKNVVIGKDDWLYNEKSVKDHYEGLTLEYADNEEELKNKLDKDVKRLKKLQTLLKERGTDIFVLMLPSKDLIYPEYLPKNVNYDNKNTIRPIDYFSEAFVQHEINFFNVSDYFKSIKDSVDFDLFPKNGMHWSNIACAYISDSIIRYMEHLSGDNYPNIRLSESYEADSKKPDDDMEDLLNLTFPIRHVENKYADVSVIADDSVKKPNLIVMGDSFFWNMTHSLPMDEIFNTYYYWYYFNTIYFDSEHNNVEEINLVKELDKADVVMISLSATQLYDINHDFISQALIQLSLNDDKVIDEVLDGIKQRMRNDENWYNSLLKKAKEKGVTIEQVMTEDAIYIVNQEPEKYISI